MYYPPQKTDMSCAEIFCDHEKKKNLMEGGGTRDEGGGRREDLTILIRLSQDS